MLIKFQPLATGQGILAHLRIEGRDQYVCVLYDERATDLTSESFVQPEAYIEFREFFQSEHGDLPLVKRYQRDPDIVTLGDDDEESLFIMDAFSSKSRGLVCLQTANRSAFANILDSIGLTKPDLMHLSELHALIHKPFEETKTKKLAAFHRVIDNLTSGKILFNEIPDELKRKYPEAREILQRNKVDIANAGKVSLGSFDRSGIPDNSGLFENIDVERLTLPYPQTAFHCITGTTDNEELFILAEQNPKNPKLIKLRFFALNDNLKPNELGFMNKDLIIDTSQTGSISLRLSDFLTGQETTQVSLNSRRSYFRATYMVAKFLNNLNRPNARLEVVSPLTKRMKFKKGLSDYFSYSVLHAPATTAEYYARYNTPDHERGEAGYEVSLHRRRAHRGLRKTHEGWKKVYVSAAWVGSSLSGVKSVLLEP